VCVCSDDSLALTLDLCLSHSSRYFEQTCSNQLLLYCRFTAALLLISRSSRYFGQICSNQLLQADCDVFNFSEVVFPCHFCPCAAFFIHSRSLSLCVWLALFALLPLASLPSSPNCLSLIRITLSSKGWTLSRHWKGWGMLTYADVCWRMLTYADVCWRMLTYADVCWRIAEWRYRPTAGPWDGIGQAESQGSRFEVVLYRIHSHACIHKCGSNICINA
jgi:hypothetical protein